MALSPQKSVPFTADVHRNFVFNLVNVCVPNWSVTCWSGGDGSGHFTYQQMRSPGVRVRSTDRCLKIRVSAVRFRPPPPQNSSPVPAFSHRRSALDEYVGFPKSRA